MATRSTRSLARRLPPRRRLVWARSARGGSPTAATFAAEANGVNTVVNALSDFEGRYGASLLGCTIMRIKFSGLFWTDPPAAGSSNAAFSWGFRVDNDQAVISASANAVDADWMWHETRYCIHGPEDTLDGAANREVMQDIKSKRKLDELGDGLFFHVKIEPGSTNPTTLRWLAEWSILIALP